MEFECYRVFSENLNEIELIANAAESALSEGQAHGRVQGNAMTRAALVLLCGYFEGYVRDLAEEYVDIINDENIPLARIPEQTLCTYIESSAATIRKNGNLLSFKQSMLQGHAPQLSKKLYSSTGGNPTVDTIEAIFQNLGVPKVIDVLSIADYGIDSTFIKESQVQQGMRDDIDKALQDNLTSSSPSAVLAVVELIERKWLPREKRRKVGYVNDIEQLLKKRNRIAHGEGSEQITPAELRDFRNKVAKLSEGLHRVLGNVLTSILEPGHRIVNGAAQLLDA